MLPRSAVSRRLPAAPTPFIRPDGSGRFECVSAPFGLVPARARDLDISRHTLSLGDLALPDDSVLVAAPAPAVPRRNHPTAGMTAPPAPRRAGDDSQGSLF